STVAHIGTFDITISAVDSYGASSSKQISIKVTDQYVKSIYVNFNNKDYPVNNLPWNSFNAAQTGGVQVVKNTAITNLKDETGFATTMSVKLMESWPQHYDGNVSGNNSG